MTEAPRTFALTQLCLAVNTLAARMPPEEAGRVTAAATQKLLDATTNSSDAGTLADLSFGLGVMAGHPPLAKDSPVAAGTAQKLLDAMAKTPDARVVTQLGYSLGLLATCLPPEEASRVFTAAAQKLLDTLAQSDPEPLGPLASQAWDVLVPRLRTADLINVLKEPTCVGEGRAALLRELGRRMAPPAPQALALAAGVVGCPCPAGITAAAGVVYGEKLYPGGRRRFVDRWEAVDWIREYHPDLDLAAPPRRAAP
jgi:hypothetical protein